MAPYADHFFEGESIKQAIDLLKKCISNDLGLALLMGEPGTGKSLALAILERTYSQRFPVGSLVCSRLGNRQELLQSISFELGLAYKGLSEGELRLGLLDYLRNSESCPEGILLLIDEAHNLSSELLDELRLLANFARRGKPQVRAVLAGGLRLEDNVADPRLESFNQRIGGRCWLTNLNRSETAGYVLDHLSRAGRDANDIFDLSALKSIYELTDGCPRYINQLCNETLASAFLSSKEQIDATLVTETWAKLQNLPSDHFCKSRLVFDRAGTDDHDHDSDSDSDSISNCGNFIAGESVAQNASSMIEFGTLDEEADSSIAGDPIFNESEEFQPECTSDDSIPIEFVDSFASASKGEAVAELNEVEANHEVATGHPDDESDDLSLSTIEDVGESFDSEYAENSEFVDSLDLESTNSEVASSDQENLEENLEENLQDNLQENLQENLFPNPFEEGFAEEEQVRDHYGPLVAAQNRASLDVTPNDLQSLDYHPLNCESTANNHEQENSVAEADLHQTSLSSENEEKDDRDRSNESAEKEAAVLIQNLCEALGESPDSFGHEQNVPHETERSWEEVASTPIFDNSENTEVAEPSELRDQKANEDYTGDIEEPSLWFNQYQDTNVDDDVDELKQLEAVREEIESQNRFSAQAFSNLLPGEQDSGSTQRWETDPARQLLAESEDHSTFGDQSFGDQSYPNSNEISPSNEQIDNESVGGWSFRPYRPTEDDLSQINAHSDDAAAEISYQTSRRSTSDQDGDTDLPTIDRSNQFEAQQVATSDDREIIVCDLDCISDFGSRAGTSSKPPTISLAPVSTGKAARMDYQELFDQLRNLPRE